MASFDPTRIVRATFRDANGDFAKGGLDPFGWPHRSSGRFYRAPPNPNDTHLDRDPDHVLCELDDGSSVTLTWAEYRGLPSALKERLEQR